MAALFRSGSAVSTLHWLAITDTVPAGSASGTGCRSRAKGISDVSFSLRMILLNSRKRWTTQPLDNKTISQHQLQLSGLFTHLQHSSERNPYLVTDWLTIKKAPPAGLEPATRWLTVSCSTNWATGECINRCPYNGHKATIIPLFGFLSIVFNPLT